MTLTTETIKQWRSDAENIARRSCEYETEYSAAEAILALTAELLANREAQPVALDVIARFKEWNTGFPIEKFKADYVIGWVLANYYAPPAPAAVKLPTEFHSDEGIMVRLEQVMAALAVVGVKYERKGGACRAAILAQPVSGGYKVVPVELTDRMIDAFNETPGTLSIEDLWRALLAAAPEGGNG